MAAARRWVPTRTALVAVSSGAAIAGMSDRPAATVVTTTNRRRSRRSRANTTPRAAPTRVHHANAGIGMALALISRLTSAALAMAATTVVQTAAIAPASAPLRTRRRVLGWLDCTTGSWWVGCGVVFSGFSLLGVCGDVETVERSRSRPCAQRWPGPTRACRQRRELEGVELVASFHRYAASLKCVARLSRIAPQPATISAKNSFSQSAPLP